MEYYRPNRSDVHLSKEEEAKMEAMTRDYFDGIAPKRHTKPRRSEDDSSSYTDALSGADSDGVIPELVEFQRLEQDHQKLVYEGEQGEEFVETEYYKDLNCISKEHHTTGTGFIRVEKTKGKAFSLPPGSEIEHHASCKGNPATNEWIPAPVDMVNFFSDKPNRSEN